MKSQGDALRLALANEREALLDGRFACLEDLTRKKEIILRGLSPESMGAKDWQHISTLASRNQNLLAAAADGIQRAIRKLEELKTGSQMAHYDSNGRKLISPERNSEVKRRA